MPEQYHFKKGSTWRLSDVSGRDLVRATCRYCKRAVVYRPEDLIVVFGDIEVDDLMGRMKCEVGLDHGHMDVKVFSPVGREAVGLKIRQLVRIDIKRVPVWKED